MMQHLTFTSATLLVALAAPAAAQVPAAPRPHAQAAAPRAPHFQERIRDGVRTGQLTRAETRQIRRHLRAFRAAAVRFRQDGLTPAERMRLRLGLRRINREIYRLRHNG